MIAWLLVGIALADVIPPMPDCPQGTKASKSHGSTWCAPASSCEATGTCATGVCVAVGLCVHTEERSSGGRRADQAATKRTITIAAGSCTTDADCPRSDDSCDVQRRCVDPDAPTEWPRGKKRVDTGGPPPPPAEPAPVAEPEPAPPAEAAGCGCVTVGTVAPLAGLVALLAALSRSARRRS